MGCTRTENETYDGKISFRFLDPRWALIWATGLISRWISNSILNVLTFKSSQWDSSIPSDRGTEQFVLISTHALSSAGPIPSDGISRGNADGRDTLFYLIFRDYCHHSPREQDTRKTSSKEVLLQLCSSGDECPHSLLGWGTFCQDGELVPLMFNNVSAYGEWFFSDTHDLATFLERQQRTLLTKPILCQISILCFKACKGQSLSPKRLPSKTLLGWRKKHYLHPHAPQSFSVAQFQRIQKKRKTNKKKTHRETGTD